MATPVNPAVWYETHYVQRASVSVNVDSLNGYLKSFIIQVGQAHEVLFNRALQVTSGNDGTHVTGSAHYKNEAVDIRSLDLTDEEQAIFSLVLGYFSRAEHIAVFDERFTASPHWHIQTADSVGG
jgi:hypothetical protein